MAKNRWLECNLRRIEKSIQAVDIPQVCGATIDGSQRTISPTAKIRELENLTQRIGECQEMVKTDQEQEWVNGVRETLKARIDLIFNPPMLNS